MQNKIRLVKGTTPKDLILKVGDLKLDGVKKIQIDQISNYVGYITATLTVEIEIGEPNERTPSNA